MKTLKPLAVVCLVLSTTLPATAVSGPGNIQAPQINLSGNIGCQGFPCLNNGTLTIPTDADYSMSATDVSAVGGIRVISTGTLTAKRNLIMPVGNFQFVAIENATTGSQSLGVCSVSASGPCLAVPIANGSAATVWFDGTSVVQSGYTGASPTGSVLSNPTTTQTITNAANGRFSVNSALNCQGSGGFGECTLFSATFNGPPPSTGTGGVWQNNNLVLNTTDYGPGTNIGGGIVDVNRSLSINHASYSRGIKQGLGITNNCYANGDCNNYFYTNYDGGLNDGSGEGGDGLGVYLGEYPQNTSGHSYFHGTISTTTGFGDTAPVLNYSSGNQWVDDGAFLIDVTQATSGLYINGASTSKGNGLNALPIAGGTLPVSTAYSLTTTSLPATTLPAATQVVDTVTVTNQTFNGSTPALNYAAGNTVCIIGLNSQPEQGFITGQTSSSGTTQVLTISHHLPHPAGTAIFQGGMCGNMFSFDADVTFTGQRTVYYGWASLTGTDLIYAFENNGNIGAVQLPMGGANQAYAGSSTGLFTYYPAAEVVDNVNGGYVLKLEPNSINFTVGDAVQVPHHMAFGIRTLTTQLQLSTPLNYSSRGTMFNQTMAGTGINSNLSSRNVTNTNPLSWYYQGGGLLGAPLGDTWTGPWLYMASLTNVPAQGFILSSGALPNNQPSTALISPFLNYTNIYAPATSCSITTAGLVTLSGTFPLTGATQYTVADPVNIQGFPGQCSPLSLVSGASNANSTPIIASVTASTMTLLATPLQVSLTTTASSTSATSSGTNYGGVLTTTMTLNSCNVPNGTTFVSFSPLTLSAAATTTGTSVCTIAIPTQTDTGSTYVSGVNAGGNVIKTGVGTWGVFNLFAQAGMFNDVWIYGSRACTAANGLCGTPNLTGTTGTITGTALSATCDSGAVTVTGATVGHAVSVSSTTGADIGGAFNLRASVTSTNTVTVYVCGTGTPASLAYNVATY